MCIVLSFWAFVWFMFKFLASIKELTNHMLYSCWEQTIGQHWNEMKWWERRMLTFYFGLRISHVDCWPSKQSQKYSYEKQYTLVAIPTSILQALLLINGILSFACPISSPFFYYYYFTFHFTIYLFISRAHRTNILEEKKKMRLISIGAITATSSSATPLTINRFGQNESESERMK